MKIVFLSGDFPPLSFGGAGISTFKLAEGMHKAGHQVLVITTCRDESEAGEREYGGIKIQRIASNYNPRWRAYLSLYNPPVVRRVKKILRQFQPDVVHANNIHFYLSYHCLKVARCYARAVIFTARDAMTFSYGKLRTPRYLENLDPRVTWIDHLKQAKKRWNPFRNLVIKRYLAYVDKIFAVSHALQQAMAVNGIGKVEVIHTGVDLQTWKVSAEAVTEVKNRYQLEGKKIIFFGGRLSGAKGGGKILAVLQSVAMKIPNVVLLVAGKIDEYTDKMKKEATALGIGGNLIFLGWVERDRIKYIYACADLVVVPSLCFDALPRVVLEGMASGKPVIGTQYGGASEVIIDGVTGYVVNPFNTTGMTSKIIELLSDSARAKRFGQAGLERISLEFNLDGMITKYLSCYQNILKHNES